MGDEPEIKVNPNIKPRTVPEALGLSDRKTKAIYESVVESVKNTKTPDIFAEIKSIYIDVDERVFAAYCVGARVSKGGNAAVKVSEEEIDRRVREKLLVLIPQIVQQVGQQALAAGQQHALHQLAEAERAGIIKIVRKGDNKQEQQPEDQYPMKGNADNDSAMPDDILYGDRGGDH